jgi:hypothetical protein
MGSTAYQRSGQVLVFLGLLGVGVTSAVDLVAGQATDFSGQWRVNHAAGNPPGRGAEQIWNVTQTANDLTVHVVVNGREVSAHTWRLGGPPIDARRDSMDTTTTAVLDKGELLITGEGTATTGVKVEIREQWLIDPATSQLRVAKISTMGGATMSRHLVLDRVAAP